MMITIAKEQILFCFHKLSLLLVLAQLLFVLSAKIAEEVCTRKNLTLHLRLLFKLNLRIWEAPSQSGVFMLQLLYYLPTLLT